MNAATNSSTHTHAGTAGTHPATIPAAPVASAAITTTSWIQYIHPTALPALRPIASCAYELKAPELGRAATISASIAITSTTMEPATRYEISTAGPARPIACPEPTKRPAPIALPSPIIEI